MKTIITEITVIGRQVFTTYNRNGMEYDGFSVHNTIKEAEAEAERLLNIFDADFISGTKEIIFK